MQINLYWRMTQVCLLLLFQMCVFIQNKSINNDWIEVQCERELCYMLGEKLKPKRTMLLSLLLFWLKSDLLKTDRGNSNSGYPHGEKWESTEALNSKWCTDETIVERHCSLDLEYLMIKCRAFYLLKQITAAIMVITPVTVVVKAVYICPQSNAKRGTHSFLESY